jgi:hypothetical protein
MARTWVLDTQTKGTGATMVPLERVLRKPGSDAVPGFHFPGRRPAPVPEPRQPHRFKVRDLMTRQLLGDDVDARGAVRALEAVGSIVDVSVQIWEPDTERWRQLSFEETSALWQWRNRLPELEQGREEIPAASSR